ncbi:hypothetical protein ACQ4M4_20595 [Leptolyngbya sp. AN02str]|uniref:hypothetical protein n=1 Tax=Leptolyngbya sp. AN02str TaxID=3423363 RepID=UPI003D314556
MKQKLSDLLLLSLLNFLADFDGELSEDALTILEELKTRSHVIPPLYADVFVLPHSATCADLAVCVSSLTRPQVAVASYAFQIFRYYEQILRANPENASKEQRVAYESQIERIRLSVARTKAALAEVMADNADPNQSGDR